MPAGERAGGVPPALVSQPGSVTAALQSNKAASAMRSATMTSNLASPGEKTLKANQLSWVRWLRHFFSASWRGCER
jgi:hypothetical protein